MQPGLFLGYVGLTQNLIAAIPVQDSTGTPKDPPIAPNYRIYNGENVMSNGTGTLAKLDVQNVTAASNATPIRITTGSDHNLQTGNRVIIVDVLGNTAANGEFTITRISATEFDLDGSVGSGTYDSGGVIHVAGLYSITHNIVGGDGFEAGKVYDLLVTFTISAVVYSQVHKFQVV